MAVRRRANASSYRLFPDHLVHRALQLASGVRSSLMTYGRR
ncbi:hypothetical protein QF026_000079 [Streptomyces aurantiacus]|nr:hypothetical protein [Streptomyces aurantiacus]MDQ0771613.1 hypothetical protein [Streptomyces aurantiacus]